MNTLHDTDSIRSLIKQALSEDLGSAGDITSESIFSNEDRVQALIKSKDTGILSGRYLIGPVFHEIDTTLTVDLHVEEGAPLSVGTEIGTVSGAIKSILAGERVVLNFLQRLSGIATRTAALVGLIDGTRAKLLDTRKTTPVLRSLEKRAVIAGGGCNHRMGLYDMILIKDTHVKAAGGPAAAVHKARDYCRTHRDIPVEVEVQSLEEFFEALSAKPDRIMLDNMSIDEMRSCVGHRDGKDPSVMLEASGNVTEQTVRAIAETGVDFISVGALTHSISALDIHLIIL